MIAPVATLLLVSLTATFAQYQKPVYYRPAVVASAPRYVPAAPLAVAKSLNPEAGAAVVQEYRDVGFDGNFNYGFDSTNGLSVKSKGYIKPPVGPNQEPIQAVEGSYTYINSFGKPETINYVADENGYRAYGDSIPQPPAPVA